MDLLPTAERPRASGGRSGVRSPEGSTARRPRFYHAVHLSQTYYNKRRQQTESIMPWVGGGGDSNGAHDMGTLDHCTMQTVAKNCLRQAD